MIWVFLPFALSVCMDVNATEASSTGIITPNDGIQRVGVAEDNGDLSVVDWITQEKTPWFSVNSTEMGIVWFHPDFNSNGRVFVSYINVDISKVEEWSASTQDLSNPTFTQVVVPSQLCNHTSPLCEWAGA